METKLVQKFGNSGHIVLPKEYVGKRIRFIAEPKTFEDIKSEVLEFLKSYFGNILGVYLYGSYARGEQTIDSDVDILVITNTKLKIAEKADDYSIISATMEEIDGILNTNAVLILPILKEARTIINPMLLDKYKEYKFTKGNVKYFVDSCKKIIELNKKGLELDFEIGSLVYSLMLRIRGLLMINLSLQSKHYSKSLLFNFLEDYDLKKHKIEELYKIYSSERNDVKVRESSILKKEDIKKLISIIEKLLEDLTISLRWARKNIKKELKASKNKLTFIEI